MNSRWVTVLRSCVALVAAFACGIAAAQVMTLYKLVDKSGKVTYSEEKPKAFDGKVIVIEVDLNANTATLPKYEPIPKGAKQAAKAAEKRLEEAKENLNKRRAALEEAITHPGEEDIGRMGIVGGRTRPVPTEPYLKRLADLEAAVKAAEEELRDAEGKK
jgi:hypothetical protein